MKRSWVEFNPHRIWAPMTYWVHRRIQDETGEGPDTAEPPWQAPVPGKGFPLFQVEIDGFTFRFSSLAELDVCVETLSRRHLPSTIDLSRQHGEGKGPNGHWLSRLPAKVKAWRYREKAVQYLQRVRPELEKALEA